MSNVNSIGTLASLKSKLPARDQEFAASMISQFAKKGSLSDKQWPWVEILIERAMSQQSSELETKNVGGMKGLVVLLGKASKKLQYPSITLQTLGERVIKLYIAGPHSKTPGYVQVIDDTTRNWLGRVSPDGVWSISHRVQDDEKADLEDLLVNMANDPVQTAQAYGHLTGRCCFCKLKLTDERSTKVGYGKTCAGNYGLPWGQDKYSFVAEEVV